MWFSSFLSLKLKAGNNSMDQGWAEKQETCTWLSHPPPCHAAEVAQLPALYRVPVWQPSLQLTSKDGIL